MQPFASDPTTPAGPLVEDRVRRHTPEHVNLKLDRARASSVAFHAQASREAIVARLAELEREWDLDRAVVTNFAVLAPISLELGLRRGAGWMALFRAQQFFLLLHMLVGWCPPSAVFRRLGFRTKAEIQAEREALLALLRDQPLAP
jgi:hypothetical protein